MLSTRDESERRHPGAVFGADIMPRDAASLNRPDARFASPESGERGAAIVDQCAHDRPIGPDAALADVSRIPCRTRARNEPLIF